MVTRHCMWVCLLALSLSVSFVSAQCGSCPIAEQDICNKCNCGLNPDGKMVVNCKNKGLTQVPTFIYDDMDYYEVTLADNAITTIPAQKFKELKALKKLDITGNPISSINADAFSGIGDTLEELLLEAVKSFNQFPQQALSVLSNLRTLSATGFGLQSSGLPSGALANLNLLSVLYLSNNDLVTLPDNALSGQESNLDELHLDRNKYSVIPTSAITRLRSLQYLTLSANALSNVPSSAFQGSTIHNLDLSQNGLSVIHDEAFKGVESQLRTLNLRSCQLTDTKLRAVKSLTALRDLELSQNSNLANLEDDFFSSMSQLQVLNLHLCGIHTVKAATFTGLTSLTDLDISANGLTSVAADTFSSTMRLDYLNLASNTNLASALPDTVFHTLASTLQTLNLEDTGFSDGHLSLIETLTSLKTLRITNNQLTMLADMGLQNLWYLQSLYLDQNSLSQITQEDLYGPNDYLMALDLHENSIQTLSQCVFHRFTKFNFYLLNLNDNPLHCDCHLEWLLDKLQEHPDYEFLKFGLNWRCATPSNLAGKNFAQLSPSDLVCNPPVTPAPCPDITPSYTPPPATTVVPHYFTVNITHVSHSSMVVTWVVGDDPDLTGFRVEYQQLPDGDTEYEDYMANVRNCTLDDLTATTEYRVCVQALGVTWLISNLCEDVSTSSPPGESTTAGDNTISIVLGCVLGVLVIIAVIAVIVVIKRKQNKKKKQQPKSGFAFGYSSGYTDNNTMGVRIGGESKRFSKPRAGQDVRNTHSKDNPAFEHRLEGFTVEERNRILGLVSQNGASTLSMVSTASNPRYIREGRLPSIPTVTRNSSYLNPQEVNDDIDKHIYFEIPEEGNYNEIPDSAV